MTSTREEVRQFNLAFGRPVNDRVVPLTVSERELLGKILFEEVVEYITLGLGLQITHSDMTSSVTSKGLMPGRFDVCLNEGQRYDPIESADGLGDVNVVIHFAAHWHGFDLDAVTTEIHRSNMSKLGADGKAIVNGETPGYTTRIIPKLGGIEGIDFDHEPEPGFDPSKPIGKILKGPNYFKPDIDSALTYAEEMCPGHVASENPKVCRRCGIHIDSLR